MMKKLMHFLSRIFPRDAQGENPVAVKAFHWMSKFKERLGKRPNTWPVASGNYRVINPNGYVAVCTLSSPLLFELFIGEEEIAIVGSLYTTNLGIEKLILNIVTNPNIQYLVICGKDSVFQAGQALQCLFNFGIDHEKRIIQAVGHFPVLKNIAVSYIDQFLKQIELVSFINENKPEFLKQQIKELHKKQVLSDAKVELSGQEINDEGDFIIIKAGGRRIPLAYDEKGFFIITTDTIQNNILVKHYYPDHRPGHFIKGRSAEAILLAILDKELVSQDSHAGYLGSELTKAETALRLGLLYEQDKPLRPLSGKGN